MVQLSYPYMTTGKTIALTRQTFVDKVMSLLYNMLSRLVITFLPRRKHLLISWLHINYYSWSYRGNSFSERGWENEMRAISSEDFYDRHTHMYS